MREGYDTAQVCVNGHVTTATALTAPDRLKDFCPTCGERTMMQCPSCEEPIQGYYHSRYVVGYAPYRPPAFCHACGQPFPWTAKRLEAGRQLALEADDLDDDERRQLADSLDDLVRDTPSTLGAAGRFKKLAAKAGKGTANALRDVMVDITSEAAKKVIWG